VNVFSEAALVALAPEVSMANKAVSNLHGNGAN